MVPISDGTEITEISRVMEIISPSTHTFLHLSQGFLAHSLGFSLSVCLSVTHVLVRAHTHTCSHLDCDALGATGFGRWHFKGKLLFKGNPESIQRSRKNTHKHARDTHTHTQHAVPLVMWYSARRMSSVSMWWINEVKNHCWLHESRGSGGSQLPAKPVRT